MPKHPTTPLASGQVNHDHLSVELIEPDGMPAMVKITWPAKPTVVDPKAFLIRRRRLRSYSRGPTSSWPA